MPLKVTHKRRASEIACLATMWLFRLRSGPAAHAWQATAGSARFHNSLSPRLAFTSLKRAATFRFASVTSEQSLSSDESKSQHDQGDEIKVPKRYVPHPFSYREEVEIRIEKLTNRGLGIGRVALSSDKINGLNEYNGGDLNSNNNQDEQELKQWVVMVPSVIPGELVKARVFRNFRNYSEADLVAIVEASGDRVTPVCPLAGDCGGCQLQHMSIEAQRRMKTDNVEEALQQYDIQNVKINPCLGTDETIGYRSKLTPHYQSPSQSRRGARNVDSDIEGSDKKIQEIGFQKQSSRQLIDVPSCPIATPAVNKAYAKVREQLLSEPPKSKKGATLLLRQGNLDDDHVETNHREFLTTTVGGLDFSYRAGNFFQNNYYVLPLMIDHVVSEAIRGGGMTHLADCYCGSGLFALSAASYFDHVVGIEINDKAIAEATANAERNGVTNCKFQAASAENIFSVINDFPRDTTTVVLDPPRKGCSDDFLAQLKDFSPRRIVYMSCDVTTQARDSAFILDAGYRITMVQPFDLFPQTRHIECLMVFERSDM